jgi:flavin-dependent dehydrogenase
MSKPDFDVIIVGGRPAGASLPIRLAQQKLNVLVIDRATFPSRPAVASSPIIYDGTMKMLDELGLKEDDYCLPGSRANQMVMDMVGHYTVVIPFAQLGLERSYIRGLDRATFDNAMWQKMTSHAPYVTARQGFSMTDVIRDESGKVIGIVGQSGKGAEERFTADLVVGADGRFSNSARKFGAKVVEERDEFTNGGYEAQWEGVLPFAEGMSAEACLYNTAHGFIIIFMPVAHGRYYVGCYYRSQDVKRNGQTPQDYYISQLQRIPQAWNRLQNARQIEKIEGIRPVENGYREAFGPGWALVGDAFHYKDPLDGQGIFDALTETKYLAEAIGKWKSGQLTWEQAGEFYKDQAWAATYPMFNMTTARVQREMHVFPPKLIIKTLIRWMLTDPGYQKTLLRALARVGNPADVPTMPSLGMIGRGILRSLQLRGKPTLLPQPTLVEAPK